MRKIIQRTNETELVLWQNTQDWGKSLAKLKERKTDKQNYGRNKITEENGAIW